MEEIDCRDSAIDLAQVRVEMDLPLQLFVTGAAKGSVYALLAVSFAVTFFTTRTFQGRRVVEEHPDHYLLEVKVWMA
jgi:hypothetical protein